MEYTQEELQEMIQGVASEVIEQEPVYAGFRSLEQRYVLADGRLVSEVFQYAFPADSDSWSAHTSTLTLL